MKVQPLDEESTPSGAAAPQGPPAAPETPPEPPSPKSPKSSKPPGQPSRLLQAPEAAGKSAHLGYLFRAFTATPAGWLREEM